MTVPWAIAGSSGYRANPSAGEYHAGERGLSAVLVPARTSGTGESATGPDNGKMNTRQQERGSGMGEPAYATHCPLCGSELAERAEPYSTRVTCPRHGRLQVDVYRHGG